MVRCLLAFAGLAVLGQSQPTAASFESSTFCRKFRCVRMDSATYRAAQFVVNTNPYLTVRWASSSIAEKDLVGINELAAEVMGAKDFDAAKFVREFLASKPKPVAGPVRRVGNFDVRCAYTLERQIELSMTLNEPSIGSATMLPDGTIVLDLRATGPGGLKGDGRLTYTKTSPDYQKILSHLGGLKPGEHKPVPPWPD